MVSEEHYTILIKGVDVWNKWIKENNYKPNLFEADLIKAKLIGADLSQADLSQADLSYSNLRFADLSQADLTGADLRGADLFRAKFRGADLTGADLSQANLTQTDLTEANLTKANMTMAKIIEVRINGATLTDCRVFGVSAWGVMGLEESKQSNLVITPINEPDITVDNLEIAQFIYLLLSSKKIRFVIDAITSKVVLILGRFSPERKIILDAIREELRKRNYLPILFDFDKPASRDLTETVSTLAHMAKFVIADVTDAKSLPQELERIVPDLPSVPIQPILLSSAEEYGMFEHFKRYHWVLNAYRYNDTNDLLKRIEEKVIIPAEEKVKELQKR